MFSEATDRRIRRGIAATVVFAMAGTVVFYFARDPAVMDAGYRPVQPIPFDHRLHAGTLGISCVYCHTGVETSPQATIPPTQTCMNCHTIVKRDSPRLAGVRESMAANRPIQWVRVHRLPDYVFFNHSRHITAGIDCASCHGRVETFGVIAMSAPLTMGWCLDCHRDPASHAVRTRPISGVDVAPEVLARPLARGPENCTTCHH